MTYYITSKNELAQEIEARQKRSTEIKEKIDKWVFSEWGIEDFSDYISTLIPKKKNNPYGVLSRQVSTIRVEEISFYMTCKLLNFEPMNITYVDDAFTTRNKDKVHLIKVPWITSHSKNGDPIVKYEKIVKFPEVGSILSSISVDGNGTNLPKYHQDLRKVAYGENCPTEVDIGPFFKKTLYGADKKPNYVYERINGKAIKSHIDQANIEIANPPADWYYPLYLLSFMTGDMVLFETYENPEGEVGNMRSHFQSVMDSIKMGTGMYPLVVEIPPLQMPMMYVNKAVLCNNWESSIRYPSSSEKNVFNIFDSFAKEIIALKESN